MNRPSDDTTRTPHAREGAMPAPEHPRTEPRIASALARLHREERAAAMTEFVICLPIFILVFVGMNNLSKLEHGMVSTKLHAVKNTWDATIEAQNTMISPSTQYIYLAGPQGVSQGSSYDNTTFSQLSDLARFGSLSGFGSFGEFGSVLSPLSAVSSADAKFNTNSFGGTDAVQDMWNERIMKPVSFNGKFSLLNLAVPVSYLAPRPVGAAGMRYGLSSGEHSETVDLDAWGSHTYEDGYVVLNAPYPMHWVPMGKYITTGFSRLGLQKHGHYSGLLDISFGGSI